MARFVIHRLGRGNGQDRDMVIVKAWGPTWQTSLLFAALIIVAADLKAFTFHKKGAHPCGDCNIIHVS